MTSPTPRARRSPSEAPPPEPAADAGQSGASSRLTRVVGANLRRLRTARGLSLERLARASAVSRAMLGQIELGRSTPTINVLWKIARALDLPFSALIGDPAAAAPAVLRESAAKVLTSRDGSFVSRALFPFEGPRQVEFYELRLAGRSVERADPHPPGTTENLVVAEGRLALVVGSTRHVLARGDAVYFVADVPHEYRNEGDERLRMYLVMTYRADQRSA